jgi:hypothetical protein
LLDLEGNCGLLAAWVALRHFHRRTSADRLISTCGFTGDGIFSVALACALYDHSLDVNFYSDFDAAMQLAERPFYSRASSLGILVQPAITLDLLTSQIGLGQLPIVLYYLPKGEPHFSILTGATADTVHFHEEGEMSRQDFEAGWNTPDTLRQAVVVGARSRS